jgi:hypothetical protein
MSKEWNDWYEDVGGHDAAAEKALEWADRRIRQSAVPMAIGGLLAGASGVLFFLGYGWHLEIMLGALMFGFIANIVIESTVPFMDEAKWHIDRIEWRPNPA